MLTGFEGVWVFFDLPVSGVNVRKGAFIFGLKDKCAQKGLKQMGF